MRSELQEFVDELSGNVRSGRMTRRTFIEKTVATGISMSAAVALLDACGTSKTSGASSNLVFWNLFGGGDGARMIQMEDAFRSATPHISLQAVTLTWGDPYYTKLSMAAAGGKPPDVAISHMTRMTILAEQNLLDPFDLDELARVGITQDNFLPAIWQKAHYNGKLYAIPLDTHPLVTYYNTDICKKAGLLDANGTLKSMQGPTAVMDALKSIKQATGNYGTVFEVEGVTLWRLFYTLYSQMGARVFSPDGKELLMDDTKAEQVLAFMTDLTVTNKVAAQNIDYAGSVALFGSGKSGFLWNGEWEVTTFQAEKTPFSMVPFPQVYDQYRTQADSHTFVLPRQTSIDPTSRANALQFISFMLKSSYTWAQGGHVPAYLPVATSGAYKALKPQSNYASVAPDVVIDDPAWFSGSGSRLETQAANAFQNAINGLGTPAQSIRQFRSFLQKMLAIKLPF